MPPYDFGRLSNLDFEELVHDLLEAEWGKRLESSKEGGTAGLTSGEPMPTGAPR